MWQNWYAPLTCSPTCSTEETKENMKYFKRENVESKIQFVVPLNMTLHSRTCHDLKPAVILNTSLLVFLVIRETGRRLRRIRERWVGITEVIDRTVPTNWRLLSKQFNCTHRLILTPLFGTSHIQLVIQRKRWDTFWLQCTDDEHEWVPTALSVTESTKLIIIFQPFC